MRKTENPVVITAFPKCINKTFFPIKTKFQPDRPHFIENQYAASSSCSTRLSNFRQSLRDVSPMVCACADSYYVSFVPQKGKHHAHSKKNKNPKKTNQAQCRLPQDVKVLPSSQSSPASDPIIRYWAVLSSFYALSLSQLYLYIAINDSEPLLDGFGLFRHTSGVLALLLSGRRACGVDGHGRCCTRRVG